MTTPAGGKPLVSIVCPTFKRPSLHRRLWQCFAWQTYEPLELVVLDNSSQPSPFFTELAEQGRVSDRLRYVHLPERRNVGNLRNRLAQLAAGEIVVTMDDDDFYGPEYVAQSVAHLLANKADLSKCSSWFACSADASWFGYLDATEPVDTGYRVLYRDGVVLETGWHDQPVHLNWVYGYGFTYTYRRSLGLRIPFNDHMTHSSDWDWVGRVLASGSRVALRREAAGQVVKVAGGDNISTFWFQYRVPPWLIPTHDLLLDWLR